jgi:methionyl-tRNA synthetase
MLTKKFDGQLGRLDEQGRKLIEQFTATKQEIIENYETLDYAAVVRKLVSMADEVNRYVEQNQPWTLIKTDAGKTQAVLTAIINASRLLTIYLKPILPAYARKVEKILNAGPFTFADVAKTLENQKINEFERLVDRVEIEKVNAMIEETREGAIPKAQAEPVEPIEPIKPEITIDDFAKCDLRIARVKKAEAVAGADRLLHLQLDLGGGIEKSVFAGIAKAYKTEQLDGKIVVCLANLKPRQMKFGLSEGMILAAGPGQSEIFMLSADAGAKPGQKVS